MFRTLRRLGWKRWPQLVIIWRTQYRPVTTVIPKAFVIADSEGHELETVPLAVVSPKPLTYRADH